MPEVTNDYCPHCNDSRAIVSEDQPGVTYWRCLDCGRIVDTVWEDDEYDDHFDATQLQDDWEDRWE